MPNLLPYAKFKEIYSQVTRLAVEVVILNAAGELLLTKRAAHGWENMWHTPGGTVLYQESVQDAVKRIAQKELGVSVQVGELLGYLEAFSEQAERGFGYSVSLVFKCTPQDFNFKINSDSSGYNFFASIPSNTVAEHKEFYSKKLNLKISTKEI